jgi:type II secretory pathway pseudopilin PulG
MSHKLNSSRIIDAFRASSLIAACILAPVTAHAQYHVSTPAYRVIPANPYNARGAWGEAVGQAYDFSQQRNNIQQWQQDQRNAWQYQEQYARQQLQQQEYLRAQQQQYQQQLRMNQQWNYANSTPRLAQPPAPMTYQQQFKATNSCNSGTTASSKSCNSGTWRRSSAPVSTGSSISPADKFFTRSLNEGIAWSRQSNGNRPRKHPFV